jgi:hypothetical protein
MSQAFHAAASWSHDDIVGAMVYDNRLTYINVIHRRVLRIPPHL